MHVGPAGQHTHAAAGAQAAPGRHARAPATRALLALAERLARGDLQRHRLAGDDVLQRPALLAREHGRVDPLGELLACDRIMPAAAAADRLVDRGRDDVGVRHRVRMQAGCDQPGEVRHVDHQDTRRPHPRSARNRSKSRNRGYADHPARINFGRRSCAIRSTSSMSIRPRLARSRGTARCRTAGRTR